MKLRLFALILALLLLLGACDTPETPGYKPSPYNTGTKITRGAARLVYARQDKDKTAFLRRKRAKFTSFIPIITTMISGNT